ncbi:MAG: hypothetical protein E7647_02635 [Ruminococcaceae bacterium]|nr:hypothetical protein [Oscillospiraceae bacterium]
MPKKHDDELIKIRKREKKEKPERQKVKKPRVKREAPPKNVPKNAPKTKGVTLDFSQEEAPRFTKYYMSVSKRYRVARILCVVILVSFLLVMLVFFRDNITYANLMYLARDLDSDTAVSVGVYSDISYEKSFSSDFALFRQRIAVASSGGFSLYSRTGATDLESDDIIADPRLEVSEKYALMYDAGERDYSVYTTIAKVLSAECEFPIEDAAVSDSGCYALLTGTDEARSLITVYSQDFRSITEYYKDKFVMDIAIDAQGEHLCAVSCDVQLSDVVCELMIGKIGTKDSVSLEYPGMMPLRVEYTDDGRLFMLCDSALIIFEGEKEVARVDFEGLTPGCFGIGGNMIAISFPTNAIGNENNVRVFDTEGKEVCSKIISEKISFVAADGIETVYAVGETKAVCISLEDEKTVTEEIDDRVIGVVCVPGSLVVCFPEGTGSYFTN